MSIHLGNDLTISSAHLVMILNLNQGPKENIFKMVDKNKSIDKIRKIGIGPFRTAIICRKGIVYLSPIESLTLSKRIKRSALGWRRIKNG